MMVVNYVEYIYGRTQLEVEVGQEEKMTLAFGSLERYLERCYDLGAPRRKPRKIGCGGCTGA